MKHFLLAAAFALTGSGSIASAQTAPDAAPATNHSYQVRVYKAIQPGTAPFYERRNSNGAYVSSKDFQLLYDPTLTTVANKPANLEIVDDNSVQVYTGLAGSKDADSAHFDAVHTGLKATITPTSGGHVQVAITDSHISGWLSTQNGKYPILLDHKVTGEIEALGKESPAVQILPSSDGYVFVVDRTS